MMEEELEHIGELEYDEGRGKKYEGQNGPGYTYTKVQFQAS